MPCGCFEGGDIEHIVRMIRAVGADHVGIGTDMDGITPATSVSNDDDTV